MGRGSRRKEEGLTEQKEKEQSVGQQGEEKIDEKKWSTKGVGGWHQAVTKGK